MPRADSVQSDFRASSQETSADTRWQLLGCFLLVSLGMTVPMKSALCQRYGACPARYRVGVRLSMACVFFILAIIWTSPYCIPCFRLAVVREGDHPR